MKIKLLLLTALLLVVTSVGFAQSKTPTFTQYAAKVKSIKNVKVNLKSHKYAGRFRTILRNAAKQDVDFAGHFILTYWNCGTNCFNSAIIDARNGKVFFPDELVGMLFGFCELPRDAQPLVYKANSRLLILNGFKGNDSDTKNGNCGTYYLEWTGTNFREVKYEQRKRTFMP